MKRFFGMNHFIDLLEVEFLRGEFALKFEVLVFEVAEVNDDWHTRESWWFSSTVETR